MPVPGRATPADPPSDQPKPSRRGVLTVLALGSAAALGWTTARSAPPAAAAPAGPAPAAPAGVAASGSAVTNGTPRSTLVGVL